MNSQKDWIWGCVEKPKAAACREQASWWKSRREVISGFGESQPEDIWWCTEAMRKPYIWSPSSFNKLHVAAGSQITIAQRSLCGGQNRRVHSFEEQQRKNAARKDCQLSTHDWKAQCRFCWTSWDDGFLIVGSAQKYSRVLKAIQVWDDKWISKKDLEEQSCLCCKTIQLQFDWHCVMEKTSKNIQSHKSHLNGLCCFQHPSQVPPEAGLGVVCFTC